MVLVQRSAVSLNFYGDDLDPADITLRLGREPTFSSKKGQTRLSAAGTEIVTQRGTWLLSAPEESPADLDRQVTALLSLVGDLEACRAVADRFGGRIFIGLFLGSGNEGVSLSPSTLAAIARSGLTVDFDIYCCGEPDDELA